MTESAAPLDFSQAQQQYVAFLRDGGKANATVLAYSKDIEQLAEYALEQGKTQPSLVGYEDIMQFQELLKKRRYTDKSISRKINSIKSFFKYLEDKGEVDHSPAHEVSHPRLDLQPPRYLSKMEYRALRDSCRHDVRIFAVVELLLQTGMRISELASLAMDDIDLERGVITIKPQLSRDGRKVPLNKPARQALVDYLKIRPKAREKTVFLTKTCRPFLVRNIRSAIDGCFKLAGIKGATLNDLRNTFIVEQLRAGTPLVYVSQLVGHKRITTTEKYLELIGEKQEMMPQVAIEEL
ncbi:MAG TPA: tyrosine-type recombinase/integrase [Candidatus Woesebacteria bacterium]|nr:tyrosine-type recombinase/integrase [Candidatus Woesebacteria bacterium]